MPGVTRAGDGSWSWIAPCGASGADNATSRDDTRDAYAAHRKECLTCGGKASSAAPTTAQAAAIGGTAVKSRVVKKATTEKAKRTSKPATIPAASSDDTPAAPPKGSKKDRERFVELVKGAKDEVSAWRAVRKEFPRDPWGKVRDITRALTAHKTWMEAYRTITAK
jgi:hypothetical protein